MNLPKRQRELLERLREGGRLLLSSVSGEQGHRCQLIGRVPGGYRSVAAVDFQAIRGFGLIHHDVTSTIACLGVTTFEYVISDKGRELLEVSDA